MSSTWTITGSEIQTLWTKIHPKLVALSWLDPNYRKKFENKNDIDFRWKEAQRIGRALSTSCPTLNGYTSEIDILITDPTNLGMALQGLLERINLKKRIPCPNTIYNIYGDTFFMINEKGFVMPWPQDPSPSNNNPANTFIAYFQGGGVLPTDPGPLNNAYTTLLKEISLQQNWTQPTSTLNQPRKEPNFTFEGLSGVALLALLEKWPKMIALAWHSSFHRQDIENDPAKYIMPEVWSQWPQDHIQMSVDDTLYDFRFSYDGNRKGIIKMEIPLPPAPATDVIIFEQLVMGYATNPLYTNTY